MSSLFTCTIYIGVWAILKCCSIFGTHRKWRPADKLVLLVGEDVGQRGTKILQKIEMVP